MERVVLVSSTETVFTRLCMAFENSGIEFQMTGFREISFYETELAKLNHYRKKTYDELERGRRITRKSAP